MATLSAEDVGLWRSWRQASARPDIDAAIRRLYAELDAAVAERGPTCWVSGRCCKFDSYGHRMYVTGLEIAWFTSNLPPSNDAQRDASQASGLVVLQPGLPDACPYQIDGLCTTHAIRPLGCRVFFCQQGTEAWQQALYEQFLTRLRTLHDDHALPYRYMEWRAGLREAELTAALLRMGDS